MDELPFSSWLFRLEILYRMVKRGAHSPKEDVKPGTLATAIEIEALLRQIWAIRKFTALDIVEPALCDLLSAVALIRLSLLEEQEFLCAIIVHDKVLGGWEWSKT